MTGILSQGSFLARARYFLPLRPSLKRALFCSSLLTVEERKCHEIPCFVFAFASRFLFLDMLKEFGAHYRSNAICLVSF
jgi:hypothetical protein